MEKKAFLIAIYSAFGFLYLGFRYGMYSTEAWSELTYNQNLNELLIWGSISSLIVFCLVSSSIYFVIKKPKNFQTKLITLITTELVAIALISGTVIINGLLNDPWFIGTIFLFSGITSLTSILYVNLIENKKQADDTSQNKHSPDRLKLEHKRYLQHINSVIWIVFFVLVGFIVQAFFGSSDFLGISVEASSSTLLNLTVVNIIGTIYVAFGLFLGVIWQLFNRIFQIEKLIN